MNNFLDTNKDLTSENVILSCLISGVYDVNRNTILENNNYDLVRDWADSLTALKVKGIIFHNSFSEKTCIENSNDFVSFIKVEHDIKYNPNIYRYFVYKKFLDTNKNLLKNIFITDISDVVLIKNPFNEKYYQENDGFIFSGDEPKILKNEWMHDHSNHLRGKIKDYKEYEKDFKNEILLNCGVIGGNINVMKQLINEICFIHENYNFDNKTAFTGDMGAFNYVVRTKFNHLLKHGFPVNTIFKEYEINRKDCWFRHK